MNFGNKAFVAGSTGRLGERCVRQLISEGISVKAGCRSKSFNKAREILPQKAEIVICNFEDVSSLQSSIDGCGTVVCALGAPENDLLNAFGPYIVDFVYVNNLILAARQIPSVKHFVLVTSLGTGKFGLPASLLNLFWGVLWCKRKSEVALIESHLPFTIIRPGGMERPTDEHELTHNAILEQQDKLFGGQISRLQVAKIVAAVVSNRESSVGKIWEAVARNDAPKVPYPELVKMSKS